jgi:hypothetical protein
MLLRKNKMNSKILTIAEQKELDELKKIPVVNLTYAQRERYLQLREKQTGEEEAQQRENQKLLNYGKEWKNE